jgi:hypothetical protein
MYGILKQILLYSLPITATSKTSLRGGVIQQHQRILSLHIQRGAHMQLNTLFKNALENIVLKFWAPEEKEALLKILYEIYNCDHDFSAAEVADFNSRLASMHVDMDHLRSVSLSEAVKILHKDKLKKDIVYTIIADAVFKDEDYDSFEKAFIEKFIRKYDISEDRLKEKIKEVRDSKIDETLKQWAHEIAEGTYDSPQLGS